MFDCLFELYIPKTHKVISKRVPTCDSAHSWQLSSAVTLGRPGHKEHDVISHSVTLSWHGGNQFLPYPNNGKHQGR